MFASNGTSQKHWNQRANRQHSSTQTACIPYLDIASFQEETAFNFEVAQHLPSIPVSVQNASLFRPAHEIAADSLRITSSKSAC